MIDISKLCKRHSVRILEDSDVEMLVEICKQNDGFLYRSIWRQYSHNDGE